MNRNWEDRRISGKAYQTDACDAFSCVIARRLLFLNSGGEPSIDAEGLCSAVRVRPCRLCAHLIETAHATMSARRNWT